MAKGVPSSKPNYSKILNMSIELAKMYGISGLRVQMIAKNLSFHHSLFYSYFGSMKELIDAVIKKALEDEILEIICDGILTNRIDKNLVANEVKEKIKDLFNNEEKKAIKLSYQNNNSND